MNFINKWIDKRLKERDRSFMQAAANNAAVNAIHYYASVRTIAQWREILDEAEKSGDKYVSLAQLIEKSGFKR